MMSTWVLDPEVTVKSSTVLGHRQRSCVVQKRKCGRLALANSGQYWIEYLYLLLAAPPYMAAANFVAITITEGCARSLEQPISTNSVPRAIFPRVAIGCRLSLKIDRNLEGSLSVATWYDSQWIGGTASGTSYISVLANRHERQSVSGDDLY